MEAVLAYASVEDVHRLVSAKSTPLDRIDVLVRYRDYPMARFPADVPVWIVPGQATVLWKHYRQSNGASAGANRRSCHRSARPGRRRIIEWNLAKFPAAQAPRAT